jgi:hypothetical protein
MTIHEQVAVAPVSLILRCHPRVFLGSCSRVLLLDAAAVVGPAANAAAAAPASAAVSLALATNSDGEQDSGQE